MHAPYRIDGPVDRGWTVVGPLSLVVQGGVSILPFDPATGQIGEAGEMLACP